MRNSRAALHECGRLILEVSNLKFGRSKISWIMLALASQVTLAVASGTETLADVPVVNEIPVERTID